MAPKTNKPWLIAGGVIGLLLLVCVASGLALYASWNFLLGQLPPPGPGPQPTAAISAGNIGKVVKLYEFSQRAIITSLAWSPDGRFLASGGASRHPASGYEVSNPQTVMLWDVTTGREWQSLTGSPGAGLYHVSVGFSPDGQLLAAASKEGITIWNVADGSRLRTLTGMSYPPEKIAFSPDSQTIIAADGSAIQSWDVTTGRMLSTYQGYSGFFYARDGKVLAWTSPRTPPYGIRLSELADGREVWTRGLGGALTALSHDGKLITNQSGTAELASDELSLLDAADGKTLRDLGMVFRPSCITFSPDDTLVAAVEGRGPLDINLLSSVRLLVWDVQSGKQYDLDTGYLDRCAAFSPDGRFLATGTDVNTVRLHGIKP